MSGIPADERHVHFQVVASLADGQPRGAESFLRWIDAAGDMVPTMAWLPQATANGALTGYAIEAHPTWIACAEHFDDLTISFNTSGQDLLDEGWMDATIGAAQASRARLALEIPHIQFDARIANEVAPVWNTPTIPDLDDRLATLRRAGLEIWLDDYGDTFRDEAIFDHPDIDLIKLDQTFLNLSVDGLADLAYRTADAGKSVIIEGIETEAQRRHAFDAGIELGQGFLFGWPMPIDEFGASIGR
ncbi:MAG: EAL domain-containing protein [Actinomycetota bacterium]